MNLKILFMLLLYWGLWISILSVSGSNVLTDAGYSTNAQLNDSSLSANESGTGGIFSSGISFGRWFLLVGFGVGLGSDAPAWFSMLLTIWQTTITVFTVGFIISSIWNG